MRPFEIYNVTFRWKNCDDMRPWLVVEAPRGGACGCFPISGQAYASSDVFELDPAHPDFTLTGLKKRCYVHFTSIVMVPKTGFGNRRGELLGGLLAAFQRESGV